MNTPDVVSQRIVNQKLASSEFKQPVEVVRWLGAVQAQDFQAAKWALGLRMRTATDAIIEAAFNEGQILRTHLLRPTWHFVAADDIRWLLQLTAPRVNLKCGPNYRKFELDGPAFKRTNKVIANALKGGKHLTRAALKEALTRAGIVVGDTVRLAHILIRAELDGVVCSGPRIGKQFTYALLEERAPAATSLTHEEALGKLTQRYFTSHGPATLQDFVWWSGLTAAQAKKGIELIDRHLRKQSIEEKAYCGPRSLPRTALRHSAHLLPVYDEYLVAYKDREAIFAANVEEPLFTTWASLGPTIIVNGTATGTWKLIKENNTTTIALKLAKSANKRAITKAAERYAAFVGVATQIVLS
jgi:hypothetical protein